MLEGHLSFPKTLSKAENILGRQLRVGVQSVQTQTSLVMLYQATAQTGLNPNPVITKKHLFTKYFHCYSVGAAGEQGQQSTTKSKFSHSYLAVRRSWAHPLSFSHYLRADKREITAFMHWTWCPPPRLFLCRKPLGSWTWLWAVMFPSLSWGRDGIYSHSFQTLPSRKGSASSHTFSKGWFMSRLLAALQLIREQTGILKWKKYSQDHTG